MKLSTKSRYGARILVALARHTENTPLQVSEIARLQEIPMKYVEQLLRTLRLAGLVSSVRGAKGGHLLAVPAESITLGQVVRLFETQQELVVCIKDPDSCHKSCDCRLRSAWAEATDALYASLDNVRIPDLIV